MALDSGATDGHKFLKDLDEEELRDPKALSNIFDSAFELYMQIDKTNEATNSPKIQSDIRRTMVLFENATRLVSLVDMFSKNEGFEEVATENIKYFLLPALLGMLTTKITGQKNRMHIVDVAEIYFVDFLKRIKEYGLIDIEIPEIKKNEEHEETVPNTHQKSNAELITEMVNKRNTKIQRFKERKELEGHLDILKKTLDNPNVDDEIKREYFTTLIKIFANTAYDELSSLATEKMLLKHAQEVEVEDNSMSSANIGKRDVHQGIPLKPIIITRDTIQKEVFGAGYPSLPVMTVQEFYEQKVRDGEWSASSHGSTVGSKSLQEMTEADQALEKEKEETALERQIENDDAEYLEKLRATDEYKDSHRRGWGNRYNRS